MKTSYRKPSRSLALVAALLGGMIGTVGLVAPAAAEHSGTLLVSNKAINTASDDWVKELKKNHKTELARDGEGWHVYFVAWLRRAPGIPQVNLVFRDEGKKKPDPIAFPIQTQPSAKILATDVMAAADRGLHPGKWDVRVTTLVKGHETTLARTTLTLK